MEKSDRIQLHPLNLFVKLKIFAMTSSDQYCILSLRVSQVHAHAGIGRNYWDG